MKKTSAVLFLLLACLFQSCTSQQGKVSTEELIQGFQNPPQEARPQVWWHWMDGNITKDGIRKDLEWMNSIGIGGIHHFDASIAMKPVVDKRLIYMDEGWKDAFVYAVNMIDSLGMELTVASSPGWSATGGPWVKPDDAMKKLVWREVLVDGGKKIDMQLPEPFIRPGEFLNFDKGERAFDYYKEIATVAIKLGSPQSMPVPHATSPAGKVETAFLLDDDPSTCVPVQGGNACGYSWVQYEFDSPQTFKSISVADDYARNKWSTQPALSNSTLQASDDGKQFRDIIDIPAAGAMRMTINFPETTAKYFRLKINDLGGKERFVKLGEFILYTGTRVERGEEKAGFAANCDIPYFQTPACAEAECASMAIDLSAYVKDGHLSWDAPEGNWKIYRFGYSLTGKKNHPAPAEATGLEVDKLDPVAYANYLRTYLDMYKSASGGMLGEKGIQYLLTDSYEAHQQTWTPALAEQFRARRGYDLLPWLPVLTGQVLVSAEQSDRFLWDWRNTIAELFAENYDRINLIIDEYGMKGRYTESHETARQLIADGMDIKRTAAIPMAAIWFDAPAISPHHATDIRESASVAHIYGQKYVAAESFTVDGDADRAYIYCPENIKPLADIELASGLNRFVIHESAHQPLDDLVPGMGLMKYGQWFNRHDTWAGLAKPWMDYLARSSYMMQQGRNVADVLVYYGEDANVTALYSKVHPAVPAGYAYDYANPTILLDLLKVQGDRLTAGNGTSYAVLWLDRNNEVMSVAVLRKLKALVDKGAKICGPAPVRIASLTDDPAEFEALVASIWGSGRSNVYASISDALAGVTPDWKTSCSDLVFVHRTLPGKEIYWVNNPTDSALETNVSFATVGLKPMLWHPDTGVIEDVTYCADGKRTLVSLNLTPQDAVFVVFDGKASKTGLVVPAKTENVLACITGPWAVKFQQGRGAPEQIEMPELASFTESTDPGVKYFSGTASYSFNVDRPATEGRVILDMGKVCNIAQVFVNGQDAGIIWRTPFRCDITDFLSEGSNTVEMKVTNVWRNRIIGDQQPGVKQPVTYVSHKFYKADAALFESGLIGPVRIIESL